MDAAPGKKMQDGNRPRDELEAGLAIDQICDRFEQAQQNGEAPRLEEFVKEIASPWRSRLFAQLLALELEWPEERPRMPDYLNRYPDYEDEVKQIFDELDLFDWEGQSLGHFDIQREIARGGMGLVYLAKDTRLDRDVAIKRLPRGRREDAKWLRRFRREARLASRLSHPNIVTIYEIGEEHDSPFIVSEFVKGSTLRQLMTQRELPIPEVIGLATQIASGMQAAHEAGIIHRDLKADNLMVREDGLLKILDFGLAKPDSFFASSESRISKSNTISGTASYMSPEQARGETLTTKTDVFSFGVLVHLMITGSLPFQGSTASDVIAKILNGAPDQDAHRLRSQPVKLQRLVQDCLAKQAEDRPRFKEILTALTDTHVARQTSRAPRGLPSTETAQDSDPTRKLDSTPTDAMRSRPVATTAQPSSIRYAQSLDVNIAWQEIGAGPIDIVFVMGWVSHLEWFWKSPSFAYFLRCLAGFARVILFDKRGTGLSDKVSVEELPDLETRMDDVRAVMKAAGSNQAILCGVSEGGPLCALFAATYPEKTLALTMIGSYSRRLWAEDYPWGPTEEQRERFLAEIAANWGGPLGLEERAPSKADDPEFREWWGSYLRMGASPGAAVALTKMNAQIDIRQVLPSIHVPTLVIHRCDDQCLHVDEGRYLAERIPGANFVELPGNDHLPFVGDADSILMEIQAFSERLRRSSPISDVLATVLSIQLRSEIDDQRLATFLADLAQEIAAFQGRDFLHSQADMLATFDGPVRSLLCARAIVRRAMREGIRIRCGMETGTCNINEQRVIGPAVELAQQVTALVPDDSVWVTQNVYNLVSNAPLTFQTMDSQLEHGSRRLSLFSVSD